MSCPRRVAIVNKSDSVTAFLYIAEQVFELDGEVMTTRDFIIKTSNNNTRRAQTAEWWSTAYGIQVVSSDNNTLVPIKEWLEPWASSPPTARRTTSPRGKS